MLSAIAERLPLYLVTGFLGAGKTSFLNRMLRDPALADTLVIVNEFGEAALDHRLYEVLEGDVSLLAAGCMCCTLRGDFVEGLSRALQSGRRFARVIVETSGLADPGPILHALFADPGLAARVRLASVTTLVDAVSGVATLEAHGEARRQVAMADRVVATKTDLAAMPGMPDARDLTPAEFLAEIHRPRPYSPRAAHGGASAHVLRAAAPLSPVAFSAFLARLRALAGPRLLRVKGLAATWDAPERPWLVQGAQHAFAPPERLAAWPPGPRETALVVIGEGLEPLTRPLWEALVYAPQDVNPLATARGGLLA